MKPEDLEARIEDLEARIDKGTASRGAEALYRQLLAVQRGLK